LLYRLDLAKPVPQVIPTAFAKNINNDHVLSPDGKFIGLSHHTGTGGDSDSAVFIVPITGGVPKPVTEKSPSYLHGWSPDGKYLLYTAERETEYDIYRIKADGGPETRLTTAKCLDDGSEYSPDGKTIYFNSCRGGKMNIWKMKTDGSKAKRLTNDQYNDWFPHVSPDGRWIVFLSFPPEVASDDHPFYKQVLLRIMPVKGGKPRVIAHLYGGQGTINVPSWSPDSQKICFASYTFGDPE
jgi:Tol biopolymer transport system component